MKIKFSNKMMKDYDAYIFLVHEGKKDLNKLEQFLKIKLNKKIQNEFEGKVNQNVNMYLQSQGKVYHIILGGLGKKEKDNNIFSEVSMTVIFLLSSPSFFVLSTKCSARLAIIGVICLFLPRSSAKFPLLLFVY